MHILLIGGTGFLGPFVVRQLLDLGHTVTVFHTGEHEPDLPPTVRHIHSPHGKFPVTTIPSDLPALNPDVVILMRANGAEDANAAMQAFKGHAARIVALSSADVYRAFARLNKIEPGPPDPVPLTEDSPLRERLYPYRSDPPLPNDHPRKPFDHYDKILVEQAVLSDPSNLPGTVLRLPMIYGPGDSQHRLYSYIKPMDDARPAIPLDETLASWHSPRGYVENVAWAITLAATNPPASNRIYNVAESPSHPEAEWVRLIADITGWQGRVVLVPKGRTDLPLDTSQHLTVSSDRIRQELNYIEPTSPTQSLQNTIAWERANPPDPAQYPLPNYDEEDQLLSELE